VAEQLASDFALERLAGRNRVCSDNPHISPASRASWLAKKCAETRALPNFW